jgi:hypothetical protein
MLRCVVIFFCFKNAMSSKRILRLYGLELNILQLLMYSYDSKSKTELKTALELYI